MQDNADLIVTRSTLLAYTGHEVKVRVPKGITAIGSLAFADNTGLEEVILPNGIKRIGSEAFSGCTALRSVRLPESLRSIGDEAFHGCVSLREIRIPERTALGTGVFWNCRSLREVSLPGRMTHIPDHLFQLCFSLGSVELPDTVRSIGDFAFCGCPLSSIALPQGLERIGVGAFNECRSLKELELPDPLTSIGSSAFSGTALKALTLPAALRELGSYAFAGCDALHSLRFLNDLKLKFCVFGHMLPKGIKQQLIPLLPRMTDAAVKQYVLFPLTWKSLSAGDRCAVFLARRSRSLLPLYRELTDKREAEAMGRRLLEAWQEAGDNGRSGLNDFLDLFGGAISPALAGRLRGALGQDQVLKEACSGGLCKRLSARDGVIWLEYLVDTDRAKSDLGFILGKDTPENRAAAAGWSLNGLTSGARNGLCAVLRRTGEPDEEGDVLPDQSDLAWCSGNCGTQLSVENGRLIYTIEACSPGCGGRARFDLGAAVRDRAEAVERTLRSFEENWLLDYTWIIKHEYIDNEYYTDWPPEDREP